MTHSTATKPGLLARHAAAPPSHLQLPPNIEVVAEYQTSTMRAVTYKRYGGPEVLKLERAPRPRPGKGQVLVRVSCASINAADYRLMRADPFLARFGNGLFRPHKMPILGADISGTVVELGPGARRLAAGDEVFGETFLDGLGGFAEYVCVREEALAKKPSKLSFAGAASIALAGVTALQAVRERARIKPADAVLVHGAGGGVGTLVVQIAKAYGAHVTAVCGPRSTSLVRSLGADAIVDYTERDFTTLDNQYDVVFGVNGNIALSTYLSKLKAKGTYVMIGGGNRQLFESILLGWAHALFRRRRVEVLTIDDKLRAQDLCELAELLDQGRIRPVVDRCFPLEEITTAMRYVELGHVPGKVVLQIG